VLVCSAGDAPPCTQQRLRNLIGGDPWHFEPFDDDEAASVVERDRGKTRRRRIAASLGDHPAQIRIGFDLASGVGFSVGTNSDLLLVACGRCHRPRGNRPQSLNG
jgi:hypothetical protein